MGRGERGEGRGERGEGRGERGEGRGRGERGEGRGERGEGRGEGRGERGEGRGERGEGRGERGEWRGERREERGRIVLSQSYDYFIYSLLIRYECSTNAEFRWLVIVALLPLFHAAHTGSLVNRVHASCSHSTLTLTHTEYFITLHPLSM